MRAWAVGLPLLAFGCALAVIGVECARAPGGAFAQFATLDWYRRYLGTRLPFRLAFAPFGLLEARWGDWDPAYTAYALTGSEADFPRGAALIWRGAALALPAAAALCAVGYLQFALRRVVWPTLVAGLAAWPRPLVRALGVFAALFPWAWALYYLAAVAALLPPTDDGPALAAYLLLGQGNPVLTKHYDLRVWVVVTGAATLWTAGAALLLAGASRVWEVARRRMRPASPPGFG
jgi:hypothetical protein